MPNWVMNVVKFDASGEKMNEIKRTITDEKCNFDFNKIIPMSPSLKLTSGSITERSLDCYRNGTDRNRRDMLMEKYKIDGDAFDAYYELGKAYDANIQQYGYPTWYEWCNANWGTKWNASETYWNSDNIVTFETAWSCPFPIFERLSEMFPDVQFEVAFADEDIGSNCGILLYNDSEGTQINCFNGGGTQISHFYDKDGEAIEFAQSIWDGTFEFEGE